MSDYEPTPAQVTDANDLKKLRPDLRKRHFWCCRCRKEPEAMESYGMHVAGRMDGTVSGEGAIRGCIRCHGEYAEYIIGFAEAHGFITRGEKIVMFDSVNALDPKKKLLPPGEGGLLN